MATTDKYDRQLRLWGAHGQRKLGQGKCIMLGTSSAGTETLKNLVLPGFGHVTIVDDKMVEGRDCGNDFFVTAESVGQPKCQVILENLLEMNPEDVQGEALNQSVASFIVEKADRISSAQLVIACDLDDCTALLVSDLCEARNIPFMLMRQYGMVGYLRISKPTSCVIEPKIAQQKIRDLRVAQPWPELEEFANRFDMDTIEEIKYIHVPYAVVLIKACQKWRADHDGAMPANFAQKQEFRQMIKASSRFTLTENFDEGLVAVTECYKSNEVLPDNITTLFNDFQHELANSTEPFWVMARALKKFVEVERRMPVQGTIPDMISLPEYYLTLQRIYLAKSQDDIVKMHAFIALEGEQSAASVDEATLTMFVRNCLQLVVLKMRTLRQELEQPDWSLDLADEMFDPDATCPRWLIAMKAFEKASARSDNPAAFSDDMAKNDAELAVMKEEAKAMTDAMGQESEIDERFLKELLRYGRSKLHCVSSFLGGVASQEACKMVMEQYLPMNHTFIYDGVHGAGEVYNL